MVFCYTWIVDRAAPSIVDMSRSRIPSPDDIQLFWLFCLFTAATLLELATNALPAATIVLSRLLLSVMDNISGRSGLVETSLLITFEWCFFWWQLFSCFTKSLELRLLREFLFEVDGNEDWSFCGCELKRLPVALGLTTWPALTDWARDGVCYNWMAAEDKNWLWPAFPAAS